MNDEVKQALDRHESCFNAQAILNLVLIILLGILGYVVWNIEQRVIVLEPTKVERE